VHTSNLPLGVLPPATAGALLSQATTTLVHFSYRIIFFISRPYTILLPSPTLATTLSMAQPDLGRLAQNIRNAGDGLQTASTELTLLENLPSIHDRQAAHNNHQELVKLIQHLTTRVDTVERGLNMRLDNVNTRLDHVNTRLDNLDARVTVK